MNLENYPISVANLVAKKVRLIERAIINERVKTGSKKWYEYQRINKSLDFDQEYIVYPNVSFGNNFSLSKGAVVNITAFVINSNSRFLLAVLNSTLIAYLISMWAISRRGGYLEYKVQYLEKLPIPVVSPTEQQPFIALADELLAGHRALHEADAAFAALLRAELGLAVPLTGKLALGREWKPWSTALQKALGRPLTLAEKAEWLPHYTQHQQQQAQRRQHLAARDAHLDQLVYALYGLSAAEIALVEGRAVAATN